MRLHKRAETANIHFKFKLDSPHVCSIVNLIILSLGHGGSSDS